MQKPTSDKSAKVIYTATVHNEKDKIVLKYESEESMADVVKQIRKKLNKHLLMEFGKNWSHEFHPSVRIDENSYKVPITIVNVTQSALDMPKTPVAKFEFAKHKRSAQAPDYPTTLYFTRSEPTVPGFYWIIKSDKIGKIKPSIALVLKIEDVLYMQEMGNIHQHAVNDCPDYLWAGPLLAPASQVKKQGVDLRDW